MRDDFAVFITSHNSPDCCPSLVSLRDAGYTGLAYIVVDDKDPALSAYYDFYSKDKLCVFSKEDYVQTLDIGMSKITPQLAAVLYARAYVENIAKMMGLRYFMVLDDDIIGFRFRMPVDNKLISIPAHNMDQILEAYLAYIESTDIVCLSFANDGSFIGGVSSYEKILERRSCHTIFIRDVSKPFEWSFAVNEDYISSLRMANIGKLLYTMPFVQRVITGMNNREDAKSGMANMYKTTTEFQRAFYATVARPDVCKPSVYNGRYVISVNKGSAYPKLISDKYRLL